MLNKLWTSIKNLSLTICNLIIYVLTFGNKKLQKSFSIQNYELELNNMKIKKQNMQESSLEMLKETKKMECRKDKFKTSLSSLTNKLEKAYENKNLKECSKLKLEIDSIKSSINSLNIALSDAEKNFNLVEKAIELLELEIAKHEIKISELKNKENTRVSLEKVNGIVKGITIGSTNGLDMKSITETIEDGLLDSKIENEILIKKLENPEEDIEFNDIDDVAKYIKSLTD